PVVRDFYYQWLSLADELDLTKTAAVYPTFDPAIGPDMQEETQRFLEDLTFDPSRHFGDIYTAPFTYMTGPLAAIYGESTVTGSTFQRVTLDGTHRKGLLTQVGFLATRAYPDADSPIHRGAYVLK